jgi:DNA-directed RNA polymerase subunit RPC12/RpoP
MQVASFPCEQCGAKLEFAAGTAELQCPYCGHRQVIPESTDAVEERDFQAHLGRDLPGFFAESETLLRCQSCAAEFTLGPLDASQKCPFCGSGVVVQSDPERRIAPEGLVPFALDAREARTKYRRWIQTRFWAPRDLKKRAEAGSTIRGIYTPFWTYDSDTRTRYTGMRGEHYWVTVNYTDSQGRTQTRSERRTRWYPASGVVSVSFDDLLVLATRRLPDRYTRDMQTWGLGGIRPYEDAYLSGFQAMRYDVGLAAGFTTAKEMMAGQIESAIRFDIGGDEQQVHSRSTEYFNTTFKHVLLPVYSGAYRYRGRIWNFYVNGQTGKVAGQAPVSPWKVALAVMLGIAVASLIGYLIYLANAGSSGTGGY